MDSLGAGRGPFHAARRPAGQHTPTWQLPAVQGGLAATVVTLTHFLFNLVPFPGCSVHLLWLHANLKMLHFCTVHIPVEVLNVYHT